MEAVIGRGAGVVSLDRPHGWLAGCIAVVALVTYLPFVNLPPLPDDYLQAELAERFGGFGQWPELAADPLYRCRATSILLTALTLKIFGFAPVMFHLTSLLGHMVNTLLVYCLGTSPLIGWRLSTIAAMIFAIRERHHEAVIWYAALPEILVFSFVLGSVLCWLRWNDSADRRWLAACFACLVLALFSKESGVVLSVVLPVTAAAHGASRRQVIWLATICAAASTAYFALSYAGRAENQHFSDGTFSLSANVLVTMANSVARGLWFWGGLSLLAIAWYRFRQYRAAIVAGAGWVCLVMLPYSFLTYMPRIPSRHHYMASVGMALIVSAAFWIVVKHWRDRRVLAIFPLLFVLHNWSYLWTYKQEQFRYRARDIERVLELLVREPGTRVVNKCEEVDENELRRAVRYRLKREGNELIVDNAGGGAVPYHCAPKKRM